ncbi:MAG: redox-sensing transcriptional repressor Rex [Desulfovibrio sp.]|nr:redox-sensing transcriptional repressor Rex [Desulfovibrio sp.]
MITPPKSSHIPRATIQRLATYVQVLENFVRDNVEVISSNPLAEACGVNGSQVRKDLAYLGEFGIRGVGYQVKSLIAAITSSLGVDREWRMALIGVGNLGKALLNHGEFRARGFNIVAIFDCDPFKIGEIVHGLEVHCTRDLKDIVSEQGIEIGIITTPPERAQRAAQHLMDAGITSILNYAPARIKVPERIHVEYVDFFHYLYSLAFNHQQPR